MTHPGSLLAGRYRLTERIATGGMGEVWSATDELLARPVAAKLVKPEYAGDPVFRQRLHAEARAAAAVRNPHVVDIYDVGEATNDDGEQVSFVVMQMLHGQSMSTVMASGALGADETADLLAQVADALAMAHSRGVVHRDVKPANLIRDGAGHVTVVDFGIARAADASALTTTGMMLGTARYISPEQVDGQPATPASDVYSLGVVAWHCLVGRPPFDAGSDVATALAHRDQPPPSLPAAIPGDLAALVTQCMAKDPGERPTAADLANAVSSLSLHGTTMAPTAVMPLDSLAPTAVLPAAVATSHSSGVSKWLEWRRLAAVAAAAVVLLGVLAIIGIANDDNHPAAAASGTTTHSLKAQQAATRTPHRVAIDPHRYIGEPFATAADQLQKRGVLAAEVGGILPTDLVTAVSPSGRVRRGATVTLTVQPPVPVPAKHPAPGHGPGPKPPHGHGAKPIPPGHAKPDKGPGSGSGEDGHG